MGRRELMAVDAIGAVEMGEREGVGPSYIRIRAGGHSSRKHNNKEKIKN